MCSFRVPQQPPNAGQPYPGQQQYAGYPPFPPQYPYAREVRPGMAVASAVLGFINAGLLIIASIVLFATAATIDSVTNGNSDFFDFGDAVAEITTDGVLDLIAAALMIVGAIQLLGRKPIGLVLTLVSSGLTVAYAIYWLVRTSVNPGALSTAILFMAIAVIAAALAIPPSVRTWLNRTAPHP